MTVSGFHFLPDFHFFKSIYHMTRFEQNAEFLTLATPGT